MKRYDLFILDSSKALVASMQDAVWELSETLNVEDTLRAALFEADKFSLVTAENTFIRLVNASDSTDKRTYRLTSVEESRIDGRHALQCEGTRIWADMGREIYEGWHPFKNIQVKTIVAELLGSSAFQIKSGGSAESDTTIIESLDFAYTTVLEAMQRIAEKADLEIEIDESTSPESIDLKTRGASNNTRFEYGINTSGMARRFRRAEVVNKVYPVGGGSPPATCKGALFEVYSISTATITVAGNKCIPSDDTYNTYKIKMVTGGDAGTSFTINDTTRGSSGDDDTIVLSSTPGSVSAGDLFMFTDSSDNELAFVPDAVSQAAYGTFDGVVRDQQFEDIRTLITPGYMDGTYTTGLHAGWTKTGTPTVAEETSIDYIQHGAASQHVTAASDTHGIYNDVSLDSSDYYSCAVNLYVVSGSVLVKITTTGATGAVEYKNQGGTSGTGWLTVELEGLPIEGATATLTIQATGGAAEFYVDAVSFTGTQQTRQFVRENGARELYRMAFDYLDENDAPMVEYDLPNALDLYAIDSTKYPFYDVSIGDTVTVIDSAMSLAASVRVLSLGYDSHGRQLRVKLSSHTSTSAAFSQVAPGIGRVIQQGHRIAQDEIDGNRTNENALSIAERLNRISGNSARASRFTGTFTATGQTSFDVGSGTLYVGTSLAYTIGSQTISGLSGGTVYYLYLTPTSASSGLQTTTTAATAYATNNIQLGVLKTGATSNDNVQIFDTTGAQVSGEVITRGLEAYDTSGNKRIDIGVVQDPSASIGNPSDWGIGITDGMQQNTSLLAEYTGAIPGAMRYLYATFGDPDEDLTYATTTQVLYNDFSVMFAKSSANMYLGKYNGELVSGSSGDLYGHELSSLLNSGSGDVRALNIGVTQAAGGGHAYGLYVGDSLGVRSTSTGNAYGIYIAAVSSTSGAAYSLYDATTNRARFGGSISVRGVDYVWPASDGTGGYFLSTDGSGNLSWAAAGGGLSGSGTTGTIAKFTGSSALGDSIITESANIITISSASTPFLKVTDTTTPVTVSLLADNSNGFLRTETNHSLFLGTGTVTQLTLVYGGTIYTTGGTFLGVGAVPSVDLHVQSASTPRIRVTDTTTPVSVDMLADNSVGYVQTQTNHNLVFRTGEVSAVTIDTSQRVGVNVTPLRPFHVSEGVPTRPSITIGSIFEGTSSARITLLANNTGNNYIHFSDSDAWDVAHIGYTHSTDTMDVKVASTDVLTLTSTGLGVKMTPARTLDVTGTFGATGAVTLGSTLTVASTAVFTTTVDINGGNIDGTVIGNAVTAAGSFTTGNFSGLMTAGNVNIDGGNIDSTPIGLTTPSTGAFTTLDVATGFNVTGAGDVTLNGNTTVLTINSASGSYDSIIDFKHASVSKWTMTSFYSNDAMYFASASTSNVLTMTQGGIVTLGAVTNNFDTVYPKLVIYTTQTNNGTDLLIESENANIDTPARFTMFKNSSNPASSDQLAKIDFYGRNSIGGAVRYGNITSSIGDASSTAEDGYIQVYLVNAGSVNTLMWEWDGVNLRNQSRNLVPFSNLNYDLGSGTLQWNNVRANGLALGVGTGTITYPVEAWVTGHASPYMRVYNGSANSSVGYAMQNDARTWFVFNNGASSDRLDFFSGSTQMYLTSGGALYNTTGTYGTISDARIKTGVTDARDYWEDFKRLQFRKYRLIDDVSSMGDAAPYRLGLVAQEVQTVFPSCVDTSNPAQYAVKSSVINTIGLKVTQENQKRIEALEAEIEKLKAA